MNKREKIFLVIFFIAFSNILKAQDCNCKELTSNLIELVEQNYAGFKFKVTGKEHNDYKKLKDNLILKSSSSEKGECNQLLNQYINYFKDKHLRISTELQTLTDVEKADFFSKTSLVTTEEKRVKEISLKGVTTTIEGIWQSEDDVYKIAIIRMGDYFEGIILETKSPSWKVGQKKITFSPTLHNTFSANFLNSDRFSILGNAYLIGENIIKGPYYTWRRYQADSVRKDSLQAIINKIIPSYKIEFKHLSDSTNYLRVPSFFPHYKKEIDSILALNKKIILACPYLIIDVRDNGGGLDDSYKELISYVYTNPIIRYPVSKLASELNIKMTEEYLLNYGKDLSGEVKNYIKSEIETMRKYKNTFTIPQKKVFLETRDTIYRNPKKIGVIINENCASSAEQFILACKQSFKVKTYGVATSGTLDFSNVAPLIFSKKYNKMQYYLFCPTSVSNTLALMPIDEGGIQPDFLLNYSELDWVDYVKKYLEN
jgi:hypothetical protein